MTINKIRRIFGISSLHIEEHSFDLMIDNRAIEMAFPGATVAWDVNSRTRQWTDFYLRINERRFTEHISNENFVLSAIKRRSNGTVERVPTIRLANGEIVQHAVVHAVYNQELERWIVIR